MSSFLFHKKRHGTHYHVKLVPCLFLQSVGVMPSYFLNTMPKYVGFSYPTSAPICAMLLSVANNILLATETRCLARYSIGRIRICSLKTRQKCCFVTPLISASSSNETSGIWFKTSRYLSSSSSLEHAATCSWHSDRHTSYLPKTPVGHS